jgi:hypothetical protein
MNRINSDVVTRILAKTVPGENECLVFVGRRVHGYGRIAYQGENRMAHRVMYEVLVAPVAKGLHVDHLCRNRSCVNVAHLQVLTPKENILSGVGACANNSRKTHCPYGHEYAHENTILQKSSRGGGPDRVCRTCDSVRRRRYLLGGDRFVSRAKEA